MLLLYILNNWSVFSQPKTAFQQAQYQKTLYGKYALRKEKFLLPGHMEDFSN